MSETQYPEDEFDRIGKRLPQGAHRPGQPWWHGFLPFVIAVIAAPLLAWALLLLIGSHPANVETSEPSDDNAAVSSQNGALDETDSGATGSADENDTGDNTSTPDEKAPEKEPPAGANQSEPVVEPSPEKTIDKSTPVAVLNASGINGLAAKTQEKISAKNYTSVTASNFTGSKPKQNTIYYSSQHVLEAKEIQQVLQIDMIVERKDVAGIQVVLVGKL